MMSDHDSPARREGRESQPRARKPRTERSLPDQSSAMTQQQCSLSVLSEEQLSAVSGLQAAKRRRLEERHDE